MRPDKITRALYRLVAEVGPGVTIVAATKYVSLPDMAALVGTAASVGQLTERPLAGALSHRGCRPWAGRGAGGNLEPCGGAARMNVEAAFEHFRSSLLNSRLGHGYILVGPPKTAGEKIADEGEGGSKIAEYLVAQKLI